MAKLRPDLGPDSDYVATAPYDLEHIYQMGRNPNEASKNFGRYPKISSAVLNSRKSPVPVMAAHAPGGPAVMYLGGYGVDAFQDQKTWAVQEAATAAGATFITFNYKEHTNPESVVRSLDFKSYLRDATRTFNSVAGMHPFALPLLGRDIPLILVGHSMGAHLTHHHASQITNHKDSPSFPWVASIINVNPVFTLSKEGTAATEPGIADRFVTKKKTQTELAETGYATNPYASSLSYSRAFIKQYDRWSLLKGWKDIGVPVTMAVVNGDIFAPVDHAKIVLSKLSHSDSELIVLPTSQLAHAFSSPEQLALLKCIVTSHVERARKAPIPKRKNDRVRELMVGKQDLSYRDYVWGTGDGEERNPNTLRARARAAGAAMRNQLITPTT